MTALTLDRDQIVTYRLRVNGLAERLPLDSMNLRRAAWAGLQDSMPRAAVLSLHARLEGVDHQAWSHPELLQVWGPRFSVFAVPAEDRAVFTVGRHPDSPKGRERAEAMMERVRTLLEPGEELEYNQAGKTLGVNPNALRYATTTGAIAVRWDGARRPTLRLLDRPEVDPREARRELVRRHLHVFGPATPQSFSDWAGVKPSSGAKVFEGLTDELVRARTPIGDGWLLAGEEDEVRRPVARPSGVRLLPSGDAFYLLQGRERELLVPDATQRDLLWTSRVWPGAVLVDGEIIGVWRRSKRTFTIEPWRTLTTTEKESIEAEAASLPLPDEGPTSVVWS